MDSGKVKALEMLIRIISERVPDIKEEMCIGKRLLTVFIRPNCWKCLILKLTGRNANYFAIYTCTQGVKLHVNQGEIDSVEIGYKYIACYPYYLTYM